ncbi:hypothetical protein [uncultured Aquimarina sp.]|uniref:hypothetical protein n=1 Tax=uncultured Aquimarina sp. TaxID=575652 RepID=UPI002630E54B|nr:hypothetical protein [uncultured Aquimarina sp.]
MIKKLMKFGLITITLFLMSFITKDVKSYVFKHPKKKKVTVLLESENLGKFKKEKRGGDFYYSNLSNLGKNNINCSVLFYKLNKDEITNLVEMPKMIMGGPDTSPAYPLAYFSNYSKLKKIESNNSQWGKPDGDFMYRQADIKEIQGQKINQKHMYAYSMIDGDMFVNIHLSKINCKAKDSTKMKAILDGFKLIK